MIFPPFGAAGQKKLAAAEVLIIGVGGLGSWAAELLARAGVGRLRLVDDDRVDFTNIHRQAMYDEADARANRPKVAAAAEHLGRINPEVTIEPVEARLDRHNIEKLAGGAHLLIDGTDNFAARFIINDFAVKTGRPWIFAGVVGAEAQTMTIVPGQTACLRCVFDAPPPPCMDPTCRSAGVMGPAVAAIASMQAMEAIKILSGHADMASGYLTKMDLWENTLQRIDAAAAAKKFNCPCCRQRIFEYLEP